MSFEERLEEILRRYVPMSGDDERDKYIIEILKIRITDLWEEMKEHVSMSFEERLEEILRRYVPMSGDDERDKYIIEILKIRITDLWEEMKEHA